MERPALSEFSPHLFWDVDLKELSWEKHTPFLVGRIMEYGVMEDWELLRKYFTIDEIADEAAKLRTLNPLTFNFITSISGRDPKSFRCYYFKAFEQTF